MTYTRRGLPGRDRDIRLCTQRVQIAKYKRRCGREPPRLSGKPLLSLSAVTALLLPAVNNVTHRSQIARREISHCANPRFSHCGIAREAGAIALDDVNKTDGERLPLRARRLLLREYRQAETF